MKKLMLIGSVFILFLTGFNVQAKVPLTELEYALESNALRIRMSSDGTGIVTGSICEGCEVVNVKITPHTQLYINGQKVGLDRAKERSGKPGTAIYNIKTKVVRKILSFD